jgi:DNA-binding response OmpR family regulator
MAHILLVEDEEQLGRLVREQFLAAGHSVHLVTDGPSAIHVMETGAPDLVILDWMLPGLDGLEVCRRIRARSIVPILMLTARAQEVDRVLGLEVGADDYLTKPFSMPELLARARALLRRISLMNERAGGEQAASVLEVGELRVDVAGRAAWVNNTAVELTPKEWDLLHVLAAHPGRAYSREYLLHTIWGVDYDGFDRTVDTHVVRLRRKLGAYGERIVTVWSVGYKLVAG